MSKIVAKEIWMIAGGVMIAAGAGESLIRWIENNRWQKRNNFLADLFIDNIDETTLPPPL